MEEKYKLSPLEIFGIRAKLTGMLEAQLQNFHHSSPDLSHSVSNLKTNFTIRFQERKKNLISKIKKALEDIELEPFLVCHSCDQQISIKKIIDVPLERLCQKCADKEYANI